MKGLNKTLTVLTIFILTLLSCNPFAESWETIYAQQEKMFLDNQKLFQLSASYLNKSVLSDTTVSIKDKTIGLPDNIYSGLRKLGISELKISSNKTCGTKDIRFIPDTLWFVDRFSILQIQYDICNERSKKGVHWKLEGSEHKHSFGQGNGWLIYSDSDRDPF